MTHATTDFSVALALLSISVTLVYLTFKARGDRPFKWLDLMLAGLMVIGSTTHLVDAATNWMPLHGLADRIRVVTASMSLAIAAALPLLIPRLLAVARERKRTEESLRMFRKLIDGSNDAFEVMDPDTYRFLDVNETACRDLGYSREELLALTVFDIDRSLSELISSGACENARATGGIIESVHRRKDGSTFPVEINVKKMQLDREYSVAVVRNSTERKRAEEALHESEERLRLAAEAGRMFAYTWDIATDIIERSGESARVLGIPNSTPLTGRDVLARIHPDDRGRLEAAMAALSPEKPQLLISYRLTRPDGSAVWIERNSRAYFDEHGKMVKLVGMVADVSERRSAQEALRQSEAELSEAQRLAAVGSWQWEPQTDTVTWSRELYRIAARDPNSAAANYQQHAQLYTPESWKRLKAAADEAMKSGTSYELDLQMVRPDGSLRWITARGEAQRNGAGRVVGLRGTAQDITDRKRAEEALSTVGQRLIEAQEQERARIARDLHDDIGQRLSVLVVELDQLREAASHLETEVHGRIDGISERAHEILSKVGSISHELHSSRLEHLGLVPAVRGLCGELAQQHQVQIDFASDGVAAALPRDASLCLFRVLQEALHNAVRHSNVRRFEVKLQGAPDEVHLSVADSGVGFDPEAATNNRGLGLISMQERLKLVQGSISIESRPSRGTTIRARVPIDGHRNAVQGATRRLPIGTNAAAIGK